MSAATFRIVRTELEKKCRLPGGKTVRQAVANASANLSTLEESSLVLIAEGLADIERMTGQGVDRLDAEVLAEMHRRADQLMGYCATVDRPRLADCLHAICSLVDAIAESEIWLPGSFGPLLLTTNLVLKKALFNKEVDLLLHGVGQCIERYAATMEGQAEPASDADARAGIGGRGHAAAPARQSDHAPDHTSETSNGKA